MVIGLMSLELEIPGAMSLKDKRSVLSRIKDRVHNKFNVSIAEVGDNDIWNYAQLGVAVVSNQQTFANQVLCKVRDLMESIHECEVVVCEMDFTHTD